MVLLGRHNAEWHVTAVCRQRDTMDTDSHTECVSIDPVSAIIELHWRTALRAASFGWPNVTRSSEEMFLNL
jgi:hypothetical protein